MLSVERFEKILEQLDQHKVIKVSELSKTLGVTEKTIRVDLEALEKRGLLKRIHGGAVLPDKEGRIFPIQERQASRSNVKQSIAAAAIKLVRPGETILMDGGSTTQALARQLGEFPVSVLTNDIKIAHELLTKEKVQLLVLGGTRIGTSSSLYGAKASDFIQRVRVNRLFFGTTGVSLQHGLTVLNGIHADWKRQVMNCADHITLLVDSSKFDKVALIQFATLDDIDVVITDAGISPEIKNELQSRDIDVVIVGK